VFTLIIPLKFEERGLYWAADYMFTENQKNSLNIRQPNALGAPTRVQLIS